MEKYTGKMIPFDIEKFNAGYEPVYRNGKTPIRVIHIPETNEDDEKIISVDKETGVQFHYESGYYLQKNVENDFDLMLKAKEVVKWVNVYKNDEGVLRVRNGELYDSEEIAKSFALKINYHATVEIRIPE